MSMKFPAVVGANGRSPLPIPMTLFTKPSIFFVYFIYTIKTLNDRLTL